MPPSVVVALSGLWWAQGCSAVDPRPADAMASLRAQHDLGPGLRGLSGLTRTDDGQWLAVEERGLRLASLQGEDSPIVGGFRPLQNVPEGLDLESVSLRGAQLFVGTEARGPRRDSDLLLTFELGDSSATVVHTQALQYGHFGLVAASNQGLEASCTTPDELFVGAETADTEGSRRRAPAWRIRGDTVVPIWLALTSREGKLAGLSCQTLPDGSVELWGIERHYEVRRVVRWVAPAMARWLQELEPAGIWDLDPALAGGPNPEGIVLLSRDDRGGAEVGIVVDNDNGGETGASMLYRVELAPIPAPR